MNNYNGKIIWTNISKCTVIPTNDEKNEICEKWPCKYENYKRMILNYKNRSDYILYGCNSRRTSTHVNQDYMLFLLNSPDLNAFHNRQWFYWARSSYFFLKILVVHTNILFNFLWIKLGFFFFSDSINLSIVGSQGPTSAQNLWCHHSAELLVFILFLNGMNSRAE